MISVHFLSLLEACVNPRTQGPLLPQLPKEVREHAAPGGAQACFPIPLITYQPIIGPQARLLWSAALC